MTRAIRPLIPSERAREGERVEGRAEAGFTLMEILIAMTVLMIGLLPLLAVFIVALRNLNRAIEDTYAAAVSQSVVDAIRLGLKDQKIELDDGTKFFILDHDGWTGPDEKDPRTQLEIDRAGFLRDLDVTQPASAKRLLERDYAILLPKATETEGTASTGGGQPRGAAFLYPRLSASDNAARKVGKYVQQTIDGPDGKPIKTRKLEIAKVYQLGRKLRDAQNAVEQKDPYPQYSFAFTIRAAKAPDPAAPTTDVNQQKTVPGLYEVVVRVFRNFNKNPDSAQNDTVGGVGREFITYVSE